MACECKTGEGVQMVPMAAYEAQAERHHHTVRTLVVCWMVSVVVLAFALICSMSYTEEAVTETETITAETLTDVSQEANENGSNYYSGGDMKYGDAESDADGN